MQCVSAAVLIKSFTSQMLRLFEGSAYLRAALIWRLDAANNCFNYVTIIFRIKGAELTSFDFDHIRAAVLIRRRCLLTFFFPNAVLIQSRRFIEGGAIRYT